MCDGSGLAIRSCKAYLAVVGESRPPYTRPGASQYSAVSEGSCSQGLGSLPWGTFFLRCLPLRPWQRPSLDTSAEASSVGGEEETEDTAFSVLSAFLLRALPSPSPSH